MPTTRGLIITPACDLQNRKVETITYLPILSLSNYFASIAFAADISAQANSLISQLNDGLSDRKIPLVARHPNPEKLSEALAQLKEQSITSGKNGKQTKDHAISAIEQLLKITDPSQKEADCQALQLIFGKKDWSALCEKLARSSLRPDLHFLPSDRQESDWSGIPTHSIVLFRYPLTIPIEVLDMAQDVGLSDWATAMTSFSRFQPVASAFRARPMKRTRLQNRIMADIITRYLSLYLRIGSPSLTKDTVADYIKEFGGIE